MKHLEKEIRTNAIDNQGKLGIHYTFKPCFKKNLICWQTREERIYLYQFRLSSHQLEIEKKIEQLKGHDCIHYHSYEIEEEIQF